MQMTHKRLNAITFIIGVQLVSYVAYLLGEPRIVWFFNLIGVGQ